MYQLIESVQGLRQYNVSVICQVSVVEEQGGFQSVGTVMKLGIGIMYVLT